MSAQVARPLTTSEHTRLPASNANNFIATACTPSSASFPRQNDDAFHQLVADLGAILGPSNGIDDGATAFFRAEWTDLIAILMR